MKRRNTTRNALFTSIIAMLVCVSMLVGATFAWFTDEVVSDRNTIAAGNLDVKLEYVAMENGAFNEANYAEVTEQIKVFAEGALYEPGYTELVKFKITNAGSLALKYNLDAVIYSETEGTNVAGEKFKLSDYLYTGLVAEEDYTTREAAVAYATKQLSLGANMATNGVLLTPGATDEIIMVLTMPTTVENEANHLAGEDNQPKIELGIKLFATQLTEETDSFDNQYDAGAPWTGDIDVSWYTANPDAETFTLTSAEDLAGLAAIVNGTATDNATTFGLRSTPSTLHDDFKGQTILLGDNIDLREIAWTPVGRIGATSTDFTYAFKGTFDGQGNTVTGLKVTNTGWAGLFGLAHSATLQNVTVKDVTINSNRMTGAVVGQLYGSLLNCHVENAVIRVVPNAVGNTFDNGDKVGGVAGWVGDNGNNRQIANCSAKNVDISAYRDVGGIAGYVAKSTTISNATVAQAKITVDQLTNHYKDEAPNAGLVFGRGTGVTEIGSTVDEQSTATATYMSGGLQLRKDGATGEVTLYLVPAEYEAETLNVPAGIDSIGNYAFAYNTNVKTVVLPESVRDLGRGFDSAPSVEKVVLNEGLEVISSRAFRSTPALKEVVISSTVKEIADNAFQKSGIKNVVIPANVETIGETAFGASLVETVTIEGNTSVQGYAFRGCTKLRTVYLNGDDVTFIASTLNGRNSTWFCNSESNNPNVSNITFYVANETVAARVKKAMGAEANNTPVYVGKVEVVNTAADLTAALADSDYVFLSQDITAPVQTTAPYGNKYGVAQNGGILNGQGNTLNFAWLSGDHYGIMTSGGTIKNLTVSGAFRAIMIMSPTEDVVIDNVVIDDEDVCYAINTGESGPTPVNLTVTNSVLKGWSSFGDAVKSVQFTDCVFGQGQYYTNVFGRLVKPYVNAVFENCEFESKFYIDLSALGADQTVTLKNCTVNGVKLTAENWQQLIVSEDDCGEGQISVEARNGSYMSATNPLDYVIIK